MNRLKNSASSFTYIPRAVLYLLGHPKLYKYLLIPVVINLILVGGLAYFSFAFLNDLLQNLLSIDWLSSISFLDEVLAVVSLFLAIIITAYLSITLAVIVQAPFNGMIAEHIFEEFGVEDKVNLSGLSMVWYDIKRSLRLETQKILLQLSILLVSLLLNLIPIVGNALFIVINFLSSYLFLNVELFDPAYSRFDYSLKRKFRQAVKYWDKNLGVNLPMYFVAGIPVINLLLLPVLFTAAGLIIGEQTVAKARS